MINQSSTIAQAGRKIGITDHPESLQDRYPCAKRVRQPAVPPELVEAVLRPRREYPRWGKDKIAVLLKEQGLRVSTSMVGRTICRLKHCGVLKEPVSSHVLARRRILKHRYAIRKPETTGLRSQATWSS